MQLDMLQEAEVMEENFNTLLWCFPRGLKWGISRMIRWMNERFPLGKKASMALETQWQDADMFLLWADMWRLYSVYSDDSQEPSDDDLNLSGRQL